VDEVPSPSYRKYFTARRNERSGSCQVAAEARALVHFTYLNLMDPWPMKGLFQVIFCRNVMIYFDKPTQQELINRFWDYLEPGGTCSWATRRVFRRSSTGFATYDRRCTRSNGISRGSGNP